MRAIVRETYGGPEQLRIRDLDIPAVSNGDVRIRVRAFGINRAETYMRRGAWGEVDRISGIECVGEIDMDPSGTFARGQRVAAIMGGLGRTRPGSYAEYTCAPRSNVFAIDTTLSWPELAAIPESFATAWWCLFKTLVVERGQTLLIRGAASALGRAAIALAADAGLDVVASTRSASKVESLRTLGAKDVILEDTEFVTRARALRPAQFDRVLELVGNKVVRESLQLVKPGGALCLAGFLAGLDPVDGFNPMFDLPSDVRFSFFGSFVLGSDGYRTHDIPMQAIVDGVTHGRLVAKPARVLPFDAIAEAHRLVESNSVEGKVVVEIT
jgi:NADPH:quinone reductase-like Zn-dependent oxidoreductase